jgi:tetratricopeptide (TPR) repeat protein
MKAMDRELERRFIQATSAAECLATLLDIASHHAASFQNLQGLRAAREALNIARVRGDSLAVGRALGTATLCHYQRGDYVAAVATGLDAVEAYADGDLLGRSHALQGIALALFSVQSPDLAETVAMRAVADARASGSPLREAGARNVYGVILAGRGRFNAARRQFRAAAATYRLQLDFVSQKKAIANLGHTYRKQADATGRTPAQVRFYLKQALRVYRVALLTGRCEADDAIVLNGMAECHCRLGDVSEAYLEAAHALELAQEVACPVILAPCLLWESHILKAMGELDAAARAAERAVKSAEELEHGSLLVDCLLAQSAVEIERGHSGTGNDLAKRARHMERERNTLLARVREEMGHLWDRYTAERSAPALRAAA